jgi:hypothetical protein
MRCSVDFSEWPATTKPPCHGTAIVPRERLPGGGYGGMYPAGTLMTVEPL